MSLALIETSHCNLDLKPAPIEPSWIIEGNPQACSSPVATSGYRLSGAAWAGETTLSGGAALNVGVASERGAVLAYHTISAISVMPIYRM